jgi:DNA-binding PadR family transcriptional regulator
MENHERHHETGGPDFDRPPDFGPVADRRGWARLMSDEFEETGRSRGRGPGRGRGRGRGPRHGWGDDRGFPRGPRAARGDIRTAILVLLGEEPMHGYQIIQEVQERSNGMWQPSPGSIYPKLQALQEEGSVEQLERSGKKVFGLTDVGRQALEAVPVDKRTPWDDLTAGAGPDVVAMQQLFKQMFQAIQQIARFGSDPQRDRAKALLDETRRRLYAILAEGADDVDV